MIMDKRLEFADATALSTSGTGTVLIGDQPNLFPNTLDDVGQGQPVYLVITVDTAVTSGGSATVAFTLASDSTATVDPSGSTKHYTTPVYPIASLVPGFRHVVALPMGQNYERYLGLLQVTATAALTGGAISAFLTLDPAGWRAYPEGQN